MNKKKIWVSVRSSEFMPISKTSISFKIGYCLYFTSRRYSQYYDSAILLLSPPAKQHQRHVTLHAVHFWGQERSYLSDQRVLPVTKREGKGEGKNSISPWMNLSPKKQGARGAKY